MILKVETSNRCLAHRVRAAARLKPVVGGGARVLYRTGREQGPGAIRF